MADTDKIGDTEFVDDTELEGKSQTTSNPAAVAEPAAPPPQEPDVGPPQEPLAPPQEPLAPPSPAGAASPTAEARLVIDVSNVMKEDSEEPTMGSNAWWSTFAGISICGKQISQENAKNIIIALGVWLVLSIMLLIALFSGGSSDGGGVDPFTQGMPSSRAAAMSTTQSMVCDPGFEIITVGGGRKSCARCEAGKYDDDRDPSTACKVCSGVAGTLPNEYGPTKCATSAQAWKAQFKQGEPLVVTLITSHLQRHTSTRPVYIRFNGTTGVFDAVLLPRGVMKNGQYPPTLEPRKTYTKKLLMPQSKDFGVLRSVSLLIENSTKSSSAVSTKYAHGRHLRIAELIVDVGKGMYQTNYSWLPQNWSQPGNAETFNVKDAYPLVKPAANSNVKVTIEVSIGSTYSAAMTSKTSTLFGTLFGSFGHTAEFVISHRFDRNDKKSFDITDRNGQPLPDFGIFEALKLHNNGTDGVYIEDIAVTVQRGSGDMVRHAWHYTSYIDGSSYASRKDTDFLFAAETAACAVKAAGSKTCLFSKRTCETKRTQSPGWNGFENGA